jgi:hypothetical protein
MAAVLLCAASLGSAQDLPPGQFHVYGPGTLSCGTWLANRGIVNAHLGQLDWVLGFVSAAGGYNVLGALRKTDSDAVSAWVDNYCREHPLNDLADAAGHLVVELSKTK